MSKAYIAHLEDSMHLWNGENISVNINFMDGNSRLLDIDTKEPRDLEIEDGLRLWTQINERLKPDTCESLDSGNNTQVSKHTSDSTVLESPGKENTANCLNNRNGEQQKTNKIKDQYLGLQNMIQREHSSAGRSDTYPIESTGISGCLGTSMSDIDEGFYQDDTWQSEDIFDEWISSHSGTNRGNDDSYNLTETSQEKRIFIPYGQEGIFDNDSATENISGTKYGVSYGSCNLGICHAPGFGGKAHNFSIGSSMIDVSSKATKSYKNMSNDVVVDLVGSGFFYDDQVLEHQNIINSQFITSPIDNNILPLKEEGIDRTILKRDQIGDDNQFGNGIQKRELAIEDTSNVVDSQQMHYAKQAFNTIKAVALKLNNNRIVNSQSGTIFNSMLVKYPTQNTLFIFDWDDTLLPSTWLSLSSTMFNDESQLPKEITEKLKHLSESSFAMLTAAREIGSTVIITNAEAGWVEMSCKKFFPHLYPLISSIRIVSARSSYGSLYLNSPYLWKLNAFRDEVQSHFSPTDRVRHIISFGDSAHERWAIHDTGAEMAKYYHTRIKSIKFMERPDIEQLQTEHQLVLGCITHLATHHENLDLYIRCIDRQNNR